MPRANTPARGRVLPERIGPGGLMASPSSGRAMRGFTVRWVGARIRPCILTPGRGWHLGRGEARLARDRARRPQSRIERESDVTRRDG